MNTLSEIEACFHIPYLFHLGPDQKQKQKTPPPPDVLNYHPSGQSERKRQNCGRSVAVGQL